MRLHNAEFTMLHSISFNTQVKLIYMKHFRLTGEKIIKTKVRPANCLTRIIFEQQEPRTQLVKWKVLFLLDLQLICTLLSPRCCSCLDWWWFWTTRKEDFPKSFCTPEGRETGNGKSLKISFSSQDSRKELPCSWRGECCGAIGFLN